MTDANRSGEPEPGAAGAGPDVPEPASEPAPGAMAQPENAGQAPQPDRPTDPHAAAADATLASQSAPPAPQTASEPPSYPPPPGPAAEPPPRPDAQAAPVVTTSVPPRTRHRTWPTTVGRILAFLFGLLQALLILRIILLLLIANPDNEIVSAIMSITDPFIEPFRGMFQLDKIEGDRGSVLDLAALVALIAWSLIETLLLSLLRVLNRSTATT